MRWRERFGQDFSVGLRESFIYLDVDRLFRSHLWLLGAVAAVALWLTGLPAAALVALLAVGLLPGLALSWMRRRRLKVLTSQWPDAALLVAASLRSGSSLSHSLTLASNELPAPAGLEFKLSVREQRFGMSLDESMRNLERRIPIEGVSLFTAAVRIAQESGGNLAETLEQLARTLRQKATLEGKIESLTAQGRLQGWVMAFMPILVGAALFAIDSPSMQALFTTWQGWCVCGGVLVLEALGLRFIRRIVSIDV
jgi:tight adherence protein B